MATLSLDDRELEESQDKIGRTGESGKLTYHEESPDGHQVDDPQ